MHNDKSFELIGKIFPIFWGIMFFGFILLFISGIIFNATQYMNRPECNDGVLIQDDAGVYRCMSKDVPIFIRGNSDGYRR